MNPTWITEILVGVYAIDADIAYPAILQELKDSVAKLPDPEKGVVELPWIAELRKLDPKKLDQYWVEVAYQFAKLELKRYLIIDGKNPWPRMVRIKTKDKKRWALASHPKGRGAEAATKGKEAREHFRRLRGFIPN